jgi:hypothetical protein
MSQIEWFGVFYESASAIQTNIKVFQSKWPPRNGTKEVVNGNDGERVAVNPRVNSMPDETIKSAVPRNRRLESNARVNSRPDETLKSAVPRSRRLESHVRVN